MPDKFDELSNAEIIDILRGYWNKPQMSDKRIWVDGQSINIPDAPAAFKPRPTVVGSRISDLLEPILSIAPELAGKFKTIQSGVSEDVVDDFIDSHRRGGQKFSPLDFENTNAAGYYNRSTGKITINPHRLNYDDELANTIAHELTHAAGHNDDLAYPIGDIYERLQRRMSQGTNVTPKDYVPYSAADLYYKLKSKVQGSGLFK